MNYSEKFITLSGHKHRYLDVGEGNKTILLLHGFSSSIEIFERVIPEFAQSYRVLALDFLGFGGSDKPLNVKYTLKFYSKLILEFLDKMNVRPTPDHTDKEVYAIGHSMGGKYLLAFASYYPPVLKKIVITNSDGFLYVPPFVSIASFSLFKKLVWKLVSSPKFIRKTMEAVYHDPSHITEEQFERNLKMVQSKTHYDGMMALNRDFRTLDLKRVGIREHLKQLRPPVLILWGDKDKFVPTKYAYVAQKEIPNSELHLFKDCGHVPMIEKPEEFVKTVISFIEK